jgi:hypothetical protein
MTQQPGKQAPAAGHLPYFTRHVGGIPPTVCAKSRQTLDDRVSHVIDCRLSLEILPALHFLSSSPTNIVDGASRPLTHIRRAAGYEDPSTPPISQEYHFNYPIGVDAMASLGGAMNFFPPPLSILAASLNPTLEHYAPSDLRPILRWPSLLFVVGLVGLAGTVTRLWTDVDQYVRQWWFARAYIDSHDECSVAFMSWISNQPDFYQARVVTARNVLNPNSYPGKSLLDVNDKGAQASQVDSDQINVRRRALAEVCCVEIHLHVQFHNEAVR